MSTKVVSVPVGAPQLFRIPPGIPYCVEAIPAATGSVLIEKSEDSGTTFVAQPLGSVATVNSISGYSSMATIVRVTAATAAATAVLSDMGLSLAYNYYNPEILINGVPYTTQTSLTTELSLFSFRFPVGSLQMNFRLEADFGFACTNNANVKTIKAYFGNSANTALEGGTICATQVLTSSAGGRMLLSLQSRNDNATVDASSIGSALGLGISTTAPISIASGVAYSGPGAVEQALVISYQKATAADVLTLSNVKLALYQ